MSEPVATRESELEARARKAGLTLIRPPAGAWVLIFGSNAGWDACTDLDEAEGIIAGNEPGDRPYEPPPGVRPPPWAATS